MWTSSMASLVAVIMTVWPALALMVWIPPVTLPPAMVIVAVTSAVGVLAVAAVVGALIVTGVGVASALGEVDDDVPPESSPHPARASTARAGRAAVVAARARRTGTERMGRSLSQCVSDACRVFRPVTADDARRGGQAAWREPNVIPEAPRHDAGPSLFTNMPR